MNHPNILGTHILTTVQVSCLEALTCLENYVIYTNQLLLTHGLEQVGFTSYRFDNGGFTVAYCLKESHICIHTWPELHTLTMDVYLCNYSRNNTSKVQEITTALVLFFKGNIIKQLEVER